MKVNGAQTQTETTRWFQVSSRGNGVGLTVIRVPISPNSNDHATLIFHILPKLWRPQYARTLTLDLGELKAHQENHFVLNEQDLIGVHDSYLVEVLTTLVENKPVTEELLAEEAVVSASENDDNSRLSPLWSVTSAPQGGVGGFLLPENSQELEGPMALWTMLDAYQVKIEPIPTSKDFGSAGMAMFATSRLMKQFVYQRFIEEVLLSLRDRRPQYVLQTDHIATVKGRITPEGLIKRKITGSAKIECEFDELTPDNHIWQVIRAAVELCVPELKRHHVKNKKTSYAKALLAAAQLRDVTVASRQALLSQAAYYTVPRQESSAVRTSYELARAILQAKFNASVNKQEAPGVVANLKYSMNGLWEQMVQEQFNKVDNTEAAGQNESAKVHIFYDRKDGQWGRALDGGKRPDIVVKYTQNNTESTFYVDAKYKANELGITKAGMGDQYQMATYALRTKRNVYLAYPTCDDKLVKKEPEFQYIPYADTYTDTQETPATHEFIQVGQFYLPFPSQENAQRKNFVLAASQLTPKRVKELSRTSFA